MGSTPMTVVYRGVCYVTFEYPYTDMASVEVSVFQEARNRIDKDISSIIQLLNEKKDTLFGDITVLEDEFEIKQQQKLNSLKQLESMKVRTEEELRDNLLSEIQGCLTQDLQSGIDKIRLETNSRTIDYTIQIDWENKLNVVREMIKEFSIKTVPNTVSPAIRIKNFPSPKKPKKKSKQNAFFSGYYCNDEINDLLNDEVSIWS